jgi:rod shape-determining protein MreD
VAATRIALLSVVMVAAVVVQVAVLPWLPFPGGTPDVVLIVVLALGLAAGSRAGAVGGFGAGLGLDLAPPVDHAIGRWAFALCLVGYLVGLVSREARESTAVALVATGVAALVTPLAFTLSGALLGDPRTSWAHLLGMLPAEVAYVLVLTPFAVPAAAALTGDRTT